MNTFLIYWVAQRWELESQTSQVRIPALSLTSVNLDFSVPHFPDLWNQDTQGTYPIILLLELN